MKKYLQYLFAGLYIFLGTAFWGCDEYLDQTPDAVVNEDDIFGTYRDFQGFVDRNYAFIVDNIKQSEMNTFLICDHAYGQYNGQYKDAEAGDYFSIIGGPSAKRSMFWASEANTNTNINVSGAGIWADGWEGIRLNNLVLKNLPLLVDATDEERNLIEGQAYFFRAFLYLEIIKSFGGMPYVDKYLGAEDDLNIPRLSYWETTEKIVADFDKAISLLPENWDNTVAGGLVAGLNAGRATKGAAMAFKAQALQYAGSPLMVNESSAKGYVFDEEYMKRGAAAAYEVIKLADKGVYSLTPWNEYYGMFNRNDGTVPFTSETIFQRFTDANSNKYNSYGQGTWNILIGRTMAPSRLGGNNSTINPTQNLINEFETINGLPISDAASGYDPMDPWKNRDPRLRGGILVDGDSWTFKSGNECQFYIGGRDDIAENASPYFCKKFWTKGCNNKDKLWAEARFNCPNMRLAHVYLIYAECANEAYGPNGKAPGANLSAVDAINIVRNRAGMPNVNAKFLGSKEEFRKRIWAERSAELFFEGFRWFDIRRWHVAHLEENRKIYRLTFPKNHSYFNQEHFATKVFEEKHYWLPIYRQQVSLYEGFQQNPGW